MAPTHEFIPAALIPLLSSVKEEPLVAIASIWLVSLTIFDFILHRIPNLSIVIGLAAALAVRFVTQGWGGEADGLAGLAVGLCVYLPFYAAGWMGGGDVKMMAVAGAFLGWRAGLLAVGLSLAAGVAVALAIIAVRGGMGEYASRYGAMLKCLLFTGQFAYVAPQPGSVATTRFPYAFAIAIGTFAALAWLGRLAPFLRALGS